MAFYWGRPKGPTCYVKSAKVDAVHANSGYVLVVVTAF